MINYSDYKNPEDLKRLRFIVEEISEKNPKGCIILDIGCGTGNVSNQLGMSEYQITGIDSDQESIDYAQSRINNSNITFIKEDIYQYPVKENYFDAIICSEFIEHLPDPDSAIKKIFKMLNDNGVLIITVPNGIGPRELLVTRPVIWIRNHRGYLWKILLKFKALLGYKGTTILSKSENLDHLQFFTINQLKRLSDMNGFKIVNIKNSNFIAGVFPLSLFYRSSRKLQTFDCWIADKLPHALVSGYYSVWVKK